MEDDLVSVDIFIEVRDVAFESLEELSFKNSLAEFRFFGGEDDLELAVEDFLDESCDAVEALRMEVVELFLVEVAEDWRPNLIKPRLIASSRAISLPV